ncbi:hypothetical protein [Thermovibrio sp.]
MGRKWRRRKLTLTTSLLISALLPSTSLAQHPSVKLIDVDGNTELNEVEASKQAYDSGDKTKGVEVQDSKGNTVVLYKGTPISFEKSCGQCHESIILDVRASHHGAVGLHDMGWMDNLKTHGDDTGAKDFVTNQVLKMRYFRSKSHYGGW